MSRSSRVGDDLSVKQMIDEGSSRVHPLSQMSWPAPKAVTVLDLRHRTPGTGRASTGMDPVLADAFSRLADQIDGEAGPAGYLHWEAAWASGSDTAYPMAKPTPSLLFKFADLADGQAEDFVRFARQHGPLDLCRHGKPATHVPADALDDLAEPYRGGTFERNWQDYEMALAAGDVGDLDPPRDYPETLVPCRRVPFEDESLSIWAAYAREASLLIDILGDLSHSKPVPLDRWRPLARHIDGPLEAILSEVPPPPQRLDRLPEATERQKKKEYAESRIALVNEQRPLIAWFVDRWLHLGGIRPRYTWGARGATLDMVGPGGLFPALALQLADLLSDSRLALVRCCNCNRRYRPRRKIRADQDNFCTRQKCQAARKSRHHRRKADTA